MRLQLRAVSVLVDTQRRKHARRLAELRERHVEADVRRAAEAHLLSFAEDRKRVARGRPKKRKPPVRIGDDVGGGNPPAAACFSARAPPRGVITSTCVRESFQRCVSASVERRRGRARRSLGGFRVYASRVDGAERETPDEDDDGRIRRGRGVGARAEGVHPSGVATKRRRGASNRVRRVRRRRRSRAPPASCVRRVSRAKR